jgi:hypothetical protein
MKPDEIPTPETDAASRLVGHRDGTPLFMVESGVARSLERRLAVAVEALELIKQGTGPYDQDLLTHACNTVKALQRDAEQALKRITEMKGGTE